MIIFDMLGGLQFLTLLCFNCAKMPIVERISSNYYFPRGPDYLLGNSLVFWGTVPLPAEQDSSYDLITRKLEEE